MRIGLVRELTPGESRVALTPHAVYELTRAGHRNSIEAGAGEGAALTDEEYRVAGARIVTDAASVWRDSELIAKVFGPVPEQYGFLREGLIVFAFLSLSVNRDLPRVLLDSRCAAFSMETVRDEEGYLPILTTMSEIAGHLAPRSEPTTSDARPEGAASSWAAPRACGRPAWSSWGQGSSVRTPPVWRVGSGRRSSS